MHTSYNLFIDDIRYPKNGNDIIARNSTEAIDIITSRGMPQRISFDHDLGGDDTSMVFIRWLTDYLLDHPTSLPTDFSYDIHSANPIGAENIRGKMDGLLSHLRKTP